MSVFYKGMKDYEIEKYKQITSSLWYIHISAEAAKRLKLIVDMATIVDSKELVEFDNT